MYCVITDYQDVHCISIIEEKNSIGKDIQFKGSLVECEKYYNSVKLEDLQNEAELNALEN